MFEITTDADETTDQRLRQALAVLAAHGTGHGMRHAIVTSAPDQDGGWEWLAALHHDLGGALRSFRYLAQKAKAGYDPGDERGSKVIDSIERHLATMERLKTDLVDRLFPAEAP